MGSTEAVKEMHHGKFAGDGRKMRYGSQIHDLLHIVGAEHHKAGLTAAHYIGVITENRKRMGGQCSGGHMKYRRCLFAGQFIHIGDHQ